MQPANPNPNTLSEIERYFGQFWSFSGENSVVVYLVVLISAFVLSVLVAWFYRYTHRGISYSQSFTHTLVLMAVVVALIMLVIGSNIARAFTLVGALAVIRFRNAVKETRDIGFMFFAMGIGMACGTKLILPALFATVTIGAFAVIMHKLNWFAKTIRERILKVQMPPDRDYERALEEPFARTLEENALISVETVRAGTLLEVVYSVVLKAGVQPAQLLTAVRAVNDGNKVSLIVGQQEIDL